MAGRQLPRGNAGAFVPNPASRTNEYFVPRDGIDREVITADICRYLGNDALVRPGTYTNPETSQVTQGYFITAYRNLTSAMITDLKNDSARWEAERRRQSGSGAVAVRYQDSHIRDGPQRAVVGGNGGHVVQPYGVPPREYDNVPRYPETEAPVYNPGAGPGAPAAYVGPGGYPGYSQPSPQAAFNAPGILPGMPDPRYVVPNGPVGGHPGGYGNPGNNNAMAAPEGYTVGSYFQAASSRDVYAQDVPMDESPNVPRRTSPNGNPAFGANPGASFRRFPNGPGGAGGSYGAYPPPPNPGAAYAQQPVDNTYGRAPTMPNQGFNNPHDFPVQQSQHDPSAGPRRDGERAGSDRPEYRERDRMSDRDHRDPTPPGKGGMSNKPVPTGHHHYSNSRR